MREWRAVLPHGRIPTRILAHGAAAGEAASVSASSDGAKMQILVDGDALPSVVREVLYRAAERVQVPLALVTNQRVRPPRSEWISVMTVPAGLDVADDRIVELAEPGDLVITADVPLAYRVVTKGAAAIDPRGDLYTDVNVRERLATRDLMHDLRSAGLVTGGPAAFSQNEVQAFADQLDRYLTKHCRG